MSETKRRPEDARPLPTLKDVGALAGVSAMTVSRVMTGSTAVRESTRERVMNAVEQLGYSPNLAARSLVGVRQLQVALLYAKPSAYIADLMFGGLEQGRRRNVQFLVEKCPVMSRAVLEIERIVEDGADGLLIAPPMANVEPVLDYIETNDIPAVVVTSGRVREKVCSVGVDAHAAALEMTRHLVALGHRRIGFIVGHPRHATSHHRLDGYREALEEAGITVDENLVAQGRFSYRSGMDAAIHLLDQRPRPSAIFASNDEMAAAVIACAHRLGLDVPADLSVVGFDDTPLASAIWPPLTTIHVPTAEVAKAAVELLIEKVTVRQGGGTFRSRHETLDYHLVRRESDGPPGG